MKNGLPEVSVVHSHCKSPADIQSRFLEAPLRAPHTPPLQTPALPANCARHKLVMWAATSVRCSAAMKAATAKTRVASGRIAPRLSAVIVMAECAGAHIALTAGCGVPASGAIVSLKGSRRSARAVVNIPSRGGRPVHVAAERFRSATAAAVIDIAVVKGCATRIVPGVVVDHVVVVPVKPPVRPAPTKTGEKADSEPDSKRKIRPAIPDAGYGYHPGHATIGGPYTTHGLYAGT